MPHVVLRLLIRVLERKELCSYQSDFPMSDRSFLRYHEEGGREGGREKSNAHKKTNHCSHDDVMELTSNISCSYLSAIIHTSRV